MNFKKIAQWIGLALLGIEGYRTMKAHHRECLKEEARQEREKNERITQSGLSSEEEFMRIQAEEDPMIALPKMLIKSVKWDIDHFRKGNPGDAVSSNTVIVSQEIKDGGKRDWVVRIKLPAYVQNLPKTPHYRDQIEEAIKTFGIKNYWLRIQHRAEYYLEDSAVRDERGFSYVEIGEVVLQNNELDAFKTETEQNGSKRFFELLRSSEFEEIEDKLGFTQNNWMIYDGNLYLSISIPYNEDMGLSKMQDFLLYLLGTQITNTDLGGRYTQDLGPVVFQAVKRNPLDNMVRYNIPYSDGEVITTPRTVVYQDDEEED